MKFKIFRFYYILIFCLCTILFFRPIFIPRSFLSLVNYVFYISTFLFIILSNKFKEKNEFSKPIFLLLLAILIAGFASWYSWGQNLLDSYKTLINYLSYGLFFLLVIWKTRIKDIEKIIFILGVVYILIFSITFLLHPLQIFGDIQEYNNDRGFQRISLPGSGFLFLFSFYSLKQYLKERKLFWLIIFIITIINVIMLLSRTLMIISFAVLTLYILRMSSLFKKILAISLIGCFFYIISQMDFFQILTEQTKEQSANKEEDIRVISATYFLNDFSPNTFSRIFGNGEGSNESSYSQDVDYLKKDLGYYQSDIGYIGLYSKFGILAILAYFIFIYKTIKVSVHDDYLYFKYYLYFIFLISIIIDASFNPGFITSIVLAAYVISCKDLKRVKNSRKP